MRTRKVNRFKNIDRNNKWFLPILVAGIVSLTVLATLFLSSFFNKPTYQIKQEFYQSNAERILTKMLGRNNYIVNISIQYSEVKQEVHSVKYTPRNVTEKYQQASSEEKRENLAEDNAFSEESNKNLSGKDHTQQKAYRYSTISEEPEKPVETEVAQQNPMEKLPGLAPRSREGSERDFPGFPKVNPFSIESKIQRKVAAKQPDAVDVNGQTYIPDSDSQESALSSAEDMNSTSKKSSTKEHVTGYETKHDKYVVKQVLDENKTTMIIPDSKIEKLYVSLVLNEDKLRELNITEGKVAKIVESVVGYSAERGDRFYLISYPFKGFAYSIRKNMTMFVEFLNKYKWFFFIVLGVPAFIFLMYHVVRLVIHLREEQMRRQREKAAEDAMKQAEATQSKIEQQQEEIIALAKNKPDDFAQALVDWIEKVDME